LSINPLNGLGAREYISLEKVAFGPFSDSGFVAGRKRRDSCGRHLTHSADSRACVSTLTNSFG
jgi:hypothetical protein